MPDWYALWRWLYQATVWICPCGCIGPDCCECCVWYLADSEDGRRTRNVIERAAQKGVVL